MRPRPSLALPLLALVAAAPVRAAEPAPVSAPPAGPVEPVEPVEPAAPAAPAAPPGTPAAAPRGPHPWDLSLEAGFGFGTANVPLRRIDGDADHIDAGGGVRLALGLRTLRLAGGLLETRAGVGLTSGPPSEAFGLDPATRWISFDAEATEDLRLGAWSLGAGWFQRIGVNTRGDAVEAERWSGRPCWVAHAEWSLVGDALTASAGLRVAQERLVSGHGAKVRGEVIGLYVSFAAHRFTPSPSPPGP